MSSFTTTTNTKVPSSVRSNVKEITLTAADIGTYRALGLSGHGADSLVNLGVNTNSLNRSIPIITFDDTVGKIARYPNTGYMPITTVVNAGSTASATLTKTRIQSAETVAKRWTNAQLSGGAMIGGFFYHDWSDQYMPIYGTEDSDATIVTSEPSAYGASTSGKFYVYNLLEELDTPGEWFFDKSTNKLYVYPPSGTTNVNISLSHDSDAIQITNSKKLTFDGITVEGATGNGIEIANTDGITIKNCNVINSSQYGIYAETMNENLLISGCTVENIGGVGIRVNGGDRTTLTSWNNKIANCTAHDFAQYERTYSAGIDIKGVGVEVKGCEIYNSPHVALRILGNDHQISSNRIHDVMLDGAKDMGAIYTGRSMTARGTVIDNNEIYNIGLSNPSSSDAFTKINGPYAIYLDDLQCGYTITNNRIHDIKGSGVFINGGRDNKVNNNTFNNISLSCVRITNFGMPAPNGGNGAGFDPTVAESKTKFDLKDEYMQQVHFDKYPHLENILSDNPTWPKYNDISHNTFYWGTGAKQIYWNGNSATDTSYYTAKWEEADFRNKGANTSTGNS